MKEFLRTYKFMKSLFVVGKIGVGTDSPTKELDINGEVRVRTIVNDNLQNKFLVADADGNIFGRTYLHVKPIKTISSAYSVLFDDHTILIDNATVFIVSLPDAVTYAGIIFNFKWLGTTLHSTQISPKGAQEIDGANSAITLSDTRKFLRLQSDGANWHSLNS